MKIMSDKEWKRYQDYITTLENQLKEKEKEHQNLEESYKELEKKYKRLKMEAFLKSGE